MSVFCINVETLLTYDVLINRAVPNTGFTIGPNTNRIQIVTLNFEAMSLSSLTLTSLY